MSRPHAASFPALSELDTPFGLALLRFAA